MNNTHTSGLIKDGRKLFAGGTGQGIVGGLGSLSGNYRSGLSTPTSNILERSLRSHNNSLEESKLSESNVNITLGGSSAHANRSLMHAAGANNSVSMSAHYTSPIIANLSISAGTSRQHQNV